VFGGSKDLKELSESYVLCISDDRIECVRDVDLVCTRSFCSTSPVIVNGSVYGIDYYKGIHKYVHQKWKMIKYFICIII
jgi:hypothetical protein